MISEFCNPCTDVTIKRVNILTEKLESKIDYSKEEWKDIKDYEGFYQISNMGRVRSMKRIVNSVRPGGHPIKEKILTPRSDGQYGYLITQIAKNGKYRTARVHRLVAENFILNTENKPFVNHKNGIKTDNRLENLEWCTPSENQLHATKIGLKVSGTTKKVIDTVTGKIYQSMTEAAKNIGYSRSQLGRSLNGDKPNYTTLRFL